MHTSSKRRDDALRALRQILRATELNSRALAKQSNLNPSQLILMHLLAKKGEMTAGSISKEISLTQATVTTLADKLEARDLIRRAKDTCDKRRVMLSLTSKGEHTLSEAPDMLQQRFSERFDTLKEWQQSYLIAALEQVADMLDAEDLDAAPVLDVGSVQTLTQ